MTLARPPGLVGFTESVTGSRHVGNHLRRVADGRPTVSRLNARVAFGKDCFLASTSLSSIFAGASLRSVLGRTSAPMGSADGLRDVWKPDPVNF